MFEVGQGGDESLAKRKIKEGILLWLGYHSKVMPVSGGSSTRRDTFWFYQDLYKDTDVEVIYKGYEIVLKRKENDRTSN